MKEKKITLETKYENEKQFFEELNSDTMFMMNSAFTFACNRLKGIMTKDEVFEWLKEAKIYDILEERVLIRYGLNPETLESTIDNETTIFDLISGPIHFGLGIYALLKAADDIYWEEQENERIRREPIFEQLDKTLGTLEKVEELDSKLHNGLMNFVRESWKNNYGDYNPADDEDFKTKWNAINADFSTVEQFEKETIMPLLGDMYTGTDEDFYDIEAYGEKFTQEYIPFGYGLDKYNNYDPDLLYEYWINEEPEQQGV